MTDSEKVTMMNFYADWRKRELARDKQLKGLELLLQQIQQEQKHMAETQDQEAADLNALTTEMGNIQSGITALEQALATAGSTTPAVDTALAGLKTAIANAAAALPPAAPAASAEAAHKHRKA